MSWKQRERITPFEAHIFFVNLESCESAGTIDIFIASNIKLMHLLRKLNVKSERENRDEVMES